VVVIAIAAAMVPTLLPASEGIALVGAGLTVAPGALPLEKKSRLIIIETFR
jgi:hypothetical protein